MIMTQSQLNQYRKGTKAFEWYEAAYRHAIFSKTNFHFTVDEFEKACLKATEE
jgi:hypothetical protein